MSGVYPRTYGGTWRFGRRLARDWGLSPHIRGNRYVVRANASGPGSIPAHTGEPVQTELKSSIARVYPRTYGGTWVGM